MREKIIVGVSIWIITGILSIIIFVTFNINIKDITDPVLLYNKIFQKNVETQNSNGKIKVNNVSNEYINILSDLFYGKDISTFSKDKNVILKDKNLSEDDIFNIILNIKASFINKTKLVYEKNIELYNTDRGVFVGYYHPNHDDEYIGEFIKKGNEYIENGFGIYIQGYPNEIYIGEWTNGYKDGIGINLWNHQLTKSIYVNNKSTKILAEYEKLDISIFLLLGSMVWIFLSFSYFIIRKVRGY